MFVDGISTGEGIFWTVVMLVGSAVCALLLGRVFQIAGAGAYRKAIRDQGEQNARKEQDRYNEIQVFDRTQDYLNKVATQERQNTFNWCKKNFKPMPRKPVTSRFTEAEHEFEEGFNGQF